MAIALASTILPLMHDGGAGFIALFGLGAVGGMTLMASVLSVPFLLEARVRHRPMAWLPVAASLVSVALGTIICIEGLDLGGTW